MVKKNIRVLPGFLLLLLSVMLAPGGYSQDVPERQNALLPDKLLVTCPVDFSGKAFETMNTFMLPGGKTFPCLYVDKALEGKLPFLNPDFPGDFYPYDDFSGRPSYGRDQILGKLSLPEGGGVAMNKAALQTYDPGELKSVLFVESWSFDAEHFRFYKEVYSVVPVRHSEDRYGRIEKRKVLEFPNIDAQARTDRNNLEKLGRIQYEFVLGNDQVVLPEVMRGDIERGNITIEKTHSPFWSSYSRKQLVRIILDKVMTGEEKAWYPGGGVELDREGIRRAFGAENLVIQIPDFQNPKKLKDTLITRDIDYLEIRSLLFIEDWYIDPETMYLEKKVLGIAPVRHYVDPRVSEKEILKKVAFVVRLREE